MPSLLLWLIIFLASTNLFAQNVIRSSDFFQIGKRTESEKIGEERSASSSRMPWIEEYDFRTETRDFDIDAIVY